MNCNTCHLDKKQEEDHVGQPILDIRDCDGLPRVCFTLWISNDMHWAEYEMGLTLSCHVQLYVINKGNLYVFWGLNILIYVMSWHLHVQRMFCCYLFTYLNATNKKWLKKLWDAFALPFVSWKGNKYCIFCVSVSLFISMQSACAVLHCRLCPAWLYHVLPHYLINGTIFVRKLFSIKCVFWFSRQVCLKH